jgi:membrane protease YdiL (CAAX protease family)
MSILAASGAAAAAAATTEPDVVGAVQAAWAVALVIWGLFIAYVLGAFRAANLIVPMRLAPTTGVAPVFVLLAVTVFAWLGTQVAFFSFIRYRLPTSETGAVNIAMLAPADMAFLGTIPALVGLAVMMMGDVLVKPTLPRELGWTLDRVRGSIWRGLLAMVSVLPLMTGAGILLQMLYIAVGYAHPREHEMLTVLGKTRDEVTKIVIVGGATLLVPIFEEFLFRGHLQTILVRLFTPRPPGLPAPQGFPVVQDGDVIPAEGTVATAAMNVPQPPPQEPEAPRDASPAGKWAAIAIASLVFAVMHPGWTWPLIFLLSLGLGYAYERTGNLWVPVVMHLSFNSAQTAIFLLFHDSL